MADSIEVTGKTVEEALDSALKELGAARDEVDFEVLDEPSRGFFGLIGSKPAKIRVTLKDIMHQESVRSAAAEVKTDEVREVAAEPANEAAVEAGAVTKAATEIIDGKVVANDPEFLVERGKNFLRDLLEAMEIKADIETSEEDEHYYFRLTGEDIGGVIGKRGQTLDSVQYLTNLAANKGIDEGRIRIVIDAEDYRRHREETLERLAIRLAEKAYRTGREVRLEPMNRRERKIIHLALQDDNRVETKSHGEEPHRYLVIVPKSRKRI